jgi:hypothetical protein
LGGGLDDPDFQPEKYFQNIFVAAHTCGEMINSYLRRFCCGHFIVENISEIALLLVDCLARYRGSETVKRALLCEQKMWWTCCLFWRERRSLFRLLLWQCEIYVRRIEEHIRVCLHASGIGLRDCCFTTKMHPVVFSRLGTSAYTGVFRLPPKKPGCADHETRDAYVNAQCR